MQFAQLHTPFKESKWIDLLDVLKCLINGIASWDWTVRKKVQIDCLLYCAQLQREFWVKKFW